MAGLMVSDSLVMRSESGSMGSWVMGRFHVKRGSPGCWMSGVSSAVDGGVCSGGVTVSTIIEPNGLANITGQLADCNVEYSKYLVFPRRVSPD